MSAIKPMSPACRAVELAAVTAAWGIMAEPMRIAAKEHGYALALHGSMARDLDLIAVAWAEHNVGTPDQLHETLLGVLRGLFGRANAHGDWTNKPHGRRAKSIMVWGGWHIDIDLSVVPPHPDSRRDDVTDELKPCPFCSAPDPLLVTHSSDAGDEYSVVCHQGCCTISDEYKAGAISAWNHRAPDPRLERLLAAGRATITVRGMSIEDDDALYELSAALDAFSTKGPTDDK